MDTTISLMRNIVHESKRHIKITGKKNSDESRIPKYKRPSKIEEKMAVIIKNITFLILNLFTKLFKTRNVEIILNTKKQIINIDI